MAYSEHEKAVAAAAGALIRRDMLLMLLLLLRGSCSYDLDGMGTLES